MPGRRKSTELLEQSGAFSKNPSRRRVDPETKGPIGDPPPSMDVKFHQTWFELADQAPVNVLRSRDRTVLELAVRVLYALRNSETLKPALVSQLNKCLASMGMTPTDASRVYAPQDKPNKPFDKFSRKARAARTVMPEHKPAEKR